MTKLFKGCLVFFGIVGCLAADATYQLTEFPIDPKKQDNTIKLKWIRADNPMMPTDSAYVLFDRKPGGAVPENYSYRVTVYKMRTSQYIEFVPKDQPNDIMNAGYFYYVVATLNATDTIVSNELNMIVRAPYAPTDLNPSLGSDSALTEYPNFSWSNVPGVPYFHVILSDEVINIDAEGGSLEGLSIVWQAITPNTTIKYGDPDPSGTITASPPPLSPGLDYNWIVLNNYGNHPAYTTTDIVVPAVFRIAGDSIAKPQNVSPDSGVTYRLADDDSIIHFGWTGSGSNVNTYNIYVYVGADFGENVDAQMVVWENTTTDTFINMDARSILTNNRYEWKVYAINDRGAGRASDLTWFRYRAPTGTLYVQTKEVVGTDTVAVSAVELEVDVVDGSLEKPLIFYTDNSGKLSRARPTGTYRLTTKKTGFLNQTRTVTVSEDQKTSIKFILQRPDATIFGRVVEPISGTSDVKGIHLADVYGLSDLGDTIKTQTDNNGYYVLNSYAENWRVWASKTGYVTAIPKDTVVSSGKSVELPNLSLERNPNILSGTIANTSAVPILGVNVKVYRSGVLVDEIAATGEDGYYAFSLSGGSYMVSASKVGFTTQTRTLELLSSKRLDLTMEPGAGVIKGNVVGKSWVTDRYVYAPLPEATIAAVNVSTNDTVITTTDATYGNYDLSLPGDNTYELISSKSGYTRISSSNQVSLDAASTVIRNDTLLAMGYVSGTVKDTAGNNMGEVMVTVVDTSTGEIGSSGESFSDGTYEVRGIPDGAYRIQAGIQGYSLLSPTNRTLVIAGGKNDTASLVLTPANKLIAWQVNTGGSNSTSITSATVKIKSPILQNIVVTDTLTGAGDGTYIVTVDASDASIIDLERHEFTVASSDSLKIETVSLPVTHAHSDTASLSQYDEMALTLLSNDMLDSVKLSYRDMNVPTYTDTMVRTSAKSYPITFVPKDGSVMFYYYTAWKGNDRYSNSKRPYSTYIPASQNLKYTEIVPDTFGGPLQLPKEYKATFAVHGYDGAFNSMDSIVGADGTVEWSLSGAPGSVVLSVDQDNPLVALVNTGSDTTTSAVTIQANVTYLYTSVTLATVFEVTNSVLNKLEVRRSDDLVNRHMSSTQQATFEAIASDTITKKQLTATPSWSIIPPEAGAITDRGVLSVRRKFVGQVRVRATAGTIASEYNSKGVNAENRGLEIRYDLAASSSPDTIDNTDEFRLVFPANVVLPGAPAEIQVKTPELKNLAKKSFQGAQGEITGKPYDIAELNNVSFQTDADSILLLLKIPKEVRSAVSKIAQWDFSLLEWDTLPNTMTIDDSTLGAKITHFSRYAVLSEAQDVGPGEVTLVPNPFSPFITAIDDDNERPGLRIRFKPNSKKDIKPKVSIRIYNMRGQQVRWLPIGPKGEKNTQLDKSLHDFYWDGKTDNGRLARNGRYLVRIAVDDGNIGEVIKPVVLFK